MNWYYSNKNQNSVMENNGYVIINAKEEIRPTMIGILTSILSKSNKYREGTYILSLSRMIENNNTKVSIRISGENNNNTALNKILSSAIKKTGGEAGGHVNAAGAVIPTSKEKLFIDTAKGILEKYALEEKVV